MYTYPINTPCLLIFNFMTLLAVITFTCLTYMVIGKWIIYLPFPYRLLFWIMDWLVPCESETGAK